MKSKFRKDLDKLNRDRAIRYKDMNKKEGKTMQQIADLEGITRQRVSQIIQSLNPRG